MMPFRFKNHSLKARRGEAPTTSLGRVCKKRKRERERERERERKEGRKAGRKAGRPHNPH